MASINRIQNFSSEAKAMRSFFEEQFADPRELHPKRFVWDRWYIENQYSLLRTPAASYFPEKIYQSFEQQLVEFGQSILGCAELTPPWLSVYTDGDSQNWHADNPHGPWAYVFSLTPWGKRKFRGGETLIMKPAMLDYWRPENLSHGLETDDLMESVPARFNQLLVFDPRLPHAVERVSGVQDPREGRLVIHGWFTKPCPFIEGALSKKQNFDWLDEVLKSVTTPLVGLTPVVGCASFRVKVKPSGAVSEVQALAQALHSYEKSISIKPVLQKIISGLKAARFPESRGVSTMTIPFIFE